MPTREDMQSLTQDIIRSYEERTAGVKELRRETQAQLQELGREHKNRHNQVTAHLQNLDKAHNTMAQNLRADLAKGPPELRRNMAAQLKELDQAHNTMGKQLRTDLAKGPPELRRNVAAQIRDVANTHAGARDEWQKMTATMQGKRGGALAEARPPVATPRPRAREVAPAPEEIAEEEAISRAEGVEVTPEIFALSNRVFDYLANHPNGTRLVELEQELGVGRLQAARVIRSLMDENRVEKRGLLYFVF